MRKTCASYSAAFAASVLAASVLARAADAESSPLKIEPASLPVELDRGWESAEVDPATGVAGIPEDAWGPVDPLRDPGPRDAVRWYRIRLDLAACGDVALAFVAFGIRDADETFLDGRRIGRLGDFPPRAGRSSLQPRLYALDPALVVQTGVHVLALRTYHGPRTSPVFRYAPQIDSLKEAGRALSWLDQIIAVQVAGAATVSATFILFYFFTRGGREFLAFACFALGLMLWSIAYHTMWSQTPAFGSFPFRLNQFGSGLLLGGYLYAVWGLVRRRLPRRLHVVAAMLLGYCLVVLAAPRPKLLEPAIAVLQIIMIVAVVDLQIAVLWALRAGRLRPRFLVVGQTAFLAAVLMAIVPMQPTGRPQLDVALRFAVVTLGFGSLVGAFLWAMAERTGRFKVAAATDPGTGLANRAALFHELSERVAAGRSGVKSPFGLALIDLDRFKEWNDSEGHPAGDRLLTEVGRGLRAACRPGDLVARYGGDEFAVVFARVDEAGLRGATTRIHGELQRVLTRHTAGRMTGCSIGAGLFSVERHGGPGDLVQEADTALYRAKHGGRNLVEIFTPVLAGQTDRRRS